MAGRREQVLDAAIDVLSSDGARGLTYQAVDNRAAAPPGTASNYFRNRVALLNAVVTHLVELDRRDWEAFAAGFKAGSIDELAEALTGFAHIAVGPGRARSCARYTLFVQAISRPELALPLAQGRETIMSWGRQWLAKLGSPTPEEHCRRLADYLDGIILHQLALPSATFDPEPGIRQFLVSMVGP